MNFNWESVLLGAIPGIFALLAVVYGEYQKRKQAREAADQTNQARREPTWNELVTENRNLRQDVTTQGDEIERIKADLSRHKTATSRKFNAFENMLRDVFRQWPAGFEHPVFNSDDLSELRDANIPWRDRVRAGP
ncbi:hypothetical protein SEA_WATERT_13 [Microbacterium phage WaterT]|nr:hypothetical protein SEA_WATERT_13 [Microbacterium phage WaterT]QDK01411.1 hypothetical protein SEA_LEEROYJENKINS_14 [Microbacterium phage LeeroyJenkins]QOC59338.1 membrane protein [Microbacterium phage Lifes]USH44469.1 membrane protein [Microbacterium phage Cassita]